LRSDDELFLHQDRKVDSFTLHPRYVDNIDRLYNDIALVHVERDFDISDPENDEYMNVAPICLPNFEGRDFLIGKDDCFSMGWGKKTFDASEYEVILKQVNLPMVENSECQNDLRSNTRLWSTWKLHESFVCAGGNEEKDVCDGDGGGPLVCRGKYDRNR
jgi:hypothetical protein